MPPFGRELWLFLMWSRSSAIAPFDLNADVRERIVYEYMRERCARCNVVIQDSARTSACFLHRERLCFTCYHRCRHPRL